ncbi:MAG: hypothetical protein V1678_02395 [Candidatus Aenigmatarchaeota archaeon]
MKTEDAKEHKNKIVLDLNCYIGCYVISRDKRFLDKIKNCNFKTCIYGYKPSEKQGCPIYNKDSKEIEELSFLKILEDGMKEEQHQNPILKLFYDAK